MMRKDHKLIIGALIILGIVIIAVYAQLVILPEQRPEIKYNLYEPASLFHNTSKVDSKFIKKYDSVPKEFVIDGEKIVLKQIDVKKSLMSPDESFNAYLIIDFRNKDEKIGFSYTDHFNAEDDKDGCAGTSTCAGFLTAETKRWETEPEVEGATSTLFINYIALVAIDYDFNKNDWNFIEIGTLQYKEHQYPATID